MVGGYLIGAHEYEAHHVFDIWYRNTSDIMPTAITGDMHSVNKANFVILYWFGPRFEPRFTKLNDQLKELYCTDDPALYEKFLIRPVGQADLTVIVDEKPNMDQIVATLGLKEMTQGSLIRKLCTYTTSNPTRRAIFEFDKIVRSIYTLRYLRDPQLERNVHRSQNRIESYHQLRSTIAQVGGKKELTGRTDIEIEISNQCARLIANAIIYYHSAILSHLLTKCEATYSWACLMSAICWRSVRPTSPGSGWWRAATQSWPRCVRAHIFLCMLAYYVEWHMREAWRELMFADEDQAAKLVRDPVAPAKRSNAAMKKVHGHTLEDGTPAHSYATLMKDLETIVRNTCRAPKNAGDAPSFQITTTPTDKQKRALELIGQIKM